MTKKEQAEFERLRSDLALARAMRWPDYPKPASMTAQEIAAAKVPGGTRYGHPQMVAMGWFQNSYSRRVTLGCSDGVHHSTDGNTTGSQNAGIMYRDKADAWRAMRHELTEKYAKELAEIDRQITAA